MFRRFLGLVILLSTIVVLIILLAGAYYFGPALDAAATGLDQSLALTVETLETVSSTLEQTKSTLVAVNGSLDTAIGTTDTLAQTVSDTIPLLEQIAVVVSDQVPSNIEALQAAVPNIAAVAGVVDTTLTKLSDFGIQQTIPIPFNPIEIDFDLGIDYEPVEPFDQTMNALGTSLDGMPEELRKVRGQLEVSAVNLLTLSNDLDQTSGDIRAINEELEQFIPILDQYLALLDRVIVAVGEVQGQIAANLETVRLVGTILPIALALTQLAPLVVGLDLLTARREPEAIAQEVKSQLAAGAYDKRAEVVREREEYLTPVAGADTLAAGRETEDTET